MFEINTIYNLDCYEAIKEIPDKSIDLVYIDPPYVLETEGAGFFGKKSDEYSLKYKGQKAYTWGGERYVMKEIDNIKNGFDFSLLDELCRVMKKINIYIWCSQKQLFPLIDYFQNKKCNWNLLTWHKTNPIPACGNKYLSDTEYCLFFREKGVKVYGTFDTKHTFYVSQSNMKDKKQFHHPTIKPLEIVKQHIINSTQENDIVLDCFIGSGTTAVACKDLNRNFIGFELNKEYYETALNRIKANTIQTTIFDFIDLANNTKNTQNDTNITQNENNEK